MKTVMTVYRVGKEPETVSIDLPLRPGFEVLNKAIKPFLDGGEIEHVRVRRAVPTSLKGQSVTVENRSMFVDDMGKLKNLPINEAVSYSTYPGPIYGTAVLLDRNVWF